MRLPKAKMMAALFLGIGLIFAGNAGAQFDQSDLSGKWYGHALYSGDFDAWEHSTITFDSSGNGEFSVMQSNGASKSGTISGLQISEKGIITSPERSSYHGALSTDKNLFTLNGTYPEDDSGNYALKVFVKAGDSFAQSDLEGTWYGHSLTAGNDPEWEHSTLEIDATGNATYSSVDSDGHQRTNEDTGSISISEKGIITIPDTPSFHGAMSPDKNLFVAVETGEEQEYILHVFVKGGAAFDDFEWADTKWYGHMLTTGDWEAWMYETLVHDTFGNCSGTGYMPGGNPFAYVCDPDNFTEEGIMTDPKTPGHGVVSADKNLMVYTDTGEFGENSEYYMLAVYTLAEQDSEGQAEAPLYFPHVATNGNWDTEIAVVNSGSESVSGTLWAYNAQGECVAIKTLDLNANGRSELNVAEEFEKPAEITHIAFISESADLCGYTKFYKEGLYRVAVPAVREINQDTIYVPHIASTADWWTGLALVNTTNSAKTLQINFNTIQSAQVKLGPGEHTSETIKELLDGTPQPDIESATISGGEGVIGLELFSKNNQLSGVLLKDQKADTLYFPHVASDQTWWTGIAAHNPNRANAKLTVTPYQENGEALDAITEDIDPRKKYLSNAKKLSLPEKTAWFQAASSESLNGFELFGNKNGKTLAGYSTVNINRKQGIFPKLEKQGWTGIAFVNTTESSATVELTAYDDQGNQIAAESIPLEGHEKTVNQPADIFTDPIAAGTYLQFNSDQDVVGFQLNGSADEMMLDALPGM